MADPILQSVSEPPKAVEVTARGKSSDTRAAELLQTIYTVSWTAATSMNLGKAVEAAKDLQDFVDPAEALEFSLEAGYEAVNRVCSEVEELARLLGIDLKKPASYRLKPVFDEE